MSIASEEHSVSSRELLAKAEESLGQDDLLQASEKSWDAAAHKVKGLAEIKGWQHTGHRELYQVVNRLAQESSDSELRVLFSVASALHSNFYEKWMPKEMVEADLNQVGVLLEKLEALS